jgi:hypothetical protein
MAKIPAYCSHCKQRFTTQNFVAGQGVVTFEGCKVSCPRCGRMAKIPDGSYVLRDQLRSFFITNKFSQDELSKLSDIIKEAQQKNSSVGEFSAVLDRELPRAGGLKKFFDAHGFNIAYVLGILLNVLLWYYPRSAPCEPPARPKGKASHLTAPTQSKRAARRHRARSKIAKSNPNKNPK